MRSLLALKLFGRASHRHVIPSVFDEGLALFTALNAIRKRSYCAASAVSRIEFYARRMLIENSIAVSVDFFHIYALSLAVALKINCDRQLTLMACSLYRLLGGAHRQ